MNELNCRASYCVLSVSYGVTKTQVFAKQAESKSYSTSFDSPLHDMAYEYSIKLCNIYLEKADFLFRKWAFSDQW